MKSFKEISDIVDERIQEYFSGSVDENDLSNILAYALESGKRIRPSLLLMTYEMLKGEITEKAISFALAMEFIHNYSLIHDDLPAMDNDEYRRGRFTVHRKYGEDLAILAGDSLLNEAFELMLAHVENKDDLKAMQVIAEYSGRKGMIKGQVLDLANKQDSIEKIIETYEFKTSRLLMASAMAGGYLAGADDETISKIREFAVNLGLAYQIKDDIFDCEEDEKITKNTALKYISKDEAQKYVEKYTNCAISAIENIEDSALILNLAKKLVERKS